MATASGTVAFAEQLDIRGIYVMIDHGYGVYSGYAHMSVLYVTQGQSVKAGQIIGQVGTTGRSSSPHAHFEMIVNGEWIDPTDFLRLPLPYWVREFALVRPAVLRAKLVEAIAALPPCTIGMEA